MTTRRQFLANSGRMALMLTALDTVFGSLLRSQIHAQVNGAFKNFLHVNLWQAPPRWGYDLFLNPSGNSSDFMANPMVTNIFTGTSHYTGADYKLVNHAGTGYKIPHLWSQEVPLSSGATSASDLLNNMISIRGIDVINAGHPGAAQLHEAAIVGSPTLGSLTADRASTSETNLVQNMIRAINIDPSAGVIFKSKEGHSSFQFNTKALNNLSTLFASFKSVSRENYNPRFASNLESMQDQVRAALNALSPGSTAYYGSLLDNSDRALSILTSNTIDVFSDLDTKWDELYSKYKNLIDGTLSRTYPGINDRRIGAVATGPAALAYQFLVSNPVFTKDGSGNVDLRAMIKNNANLDRLAAQFAVVEFLMIHKMCPSINFLPEGFKALDVNGTEKDMTFDQHNMGYMPGIYLNSMFFLCLTSCMLELIAALKSKNLFNDTLIYMAGEFNRSARLDGGGSDHGEKAGSVSLISGRINQFKIIGNIYQDSAGEGTFADKARPGTWGYAAPIGRTKQVPLNIIQTWASVMNLLGMPLASIPNAVDKTRLIFETAGSFAVGSEYNMAPKNVRNKV